MRNLKALFVLVTFIFTNLTPPNGWAQVLDSKANASLITALGLMPSPGHSVSLSPGFDLAHFKGMVIDPNDPFKFDFIIHQGDEQLDRNQKQQEYTKLIKYFLAALAVPDTDQWVNLSPYEKNRVIETDFGKTAMGRDLLAQDYLLKQLSSSLTNPDTGLGQKFWDQVYERVYKQFGRRDIPLNTFNKVWIIPDKAVIYEKGNMMYVIESHLKVMTEEDYLATKKHHQDQVMNDKSKAVGISNAVMRQIIIPAIEQEVNTGKNFAPLRQVLSGMLLATWYKRALKESILGKLYANKSKLNGINQDPKVNEKIFQEYIRAYKKGVYNMIKEDTDPVTQEVIPRKYFSGGFFNALALKGAIVDGPRSWAADDFAQQTSAMVTVSTELTPPGDLPRMANAIKLKAKRMLLKGAAKAKGKFVLAGTIALNLLASHIAKAQSSVTFAWNPSPDPTVIGYSLQMLKDGVNVYNQIDAGTNSYISVPLSQLSPGDNSFEVVAYNYQGMKSPPSNLLDYPIAPVPAAPVQVLSNQSLPPQTFQVTGIPVGSVVSSVIPNNPAITNVVVTPTSATTATVTFNAPNQYLSNVTFTTYLNGTPSPFAINNVGVIPGYANAVYGTAPQIVNMVTQYGFPTADVNLLTATASNPNLFAIQPYFDASGSLHYTLNSVSGSATITIVDTNPNNPQQTVITVNANTPPSIAFVPAAPTTVGAYQFAHVTIQATGGSSNQLYNVTVMGATNGMNFIPLGTIKVLGSGSITWYDPNTALSQMRLYSGVVKGLLPPVTPPLTAAESKRLSNMVKNLALNQNFGPVNTPPGFFPNAKTSKTPASIKDITTPEKLVASSPVFRFDYKTTPPTVTKMALAQNGKSFVPFVPVKYSRPIRNSGPFVNPRMFSPPKNFAGLNTGRARSNAAMLDPGGIDFAQSNLDMQIKRDGQGMPLPMSQQNLDNIHIDGLVPVILDIKPVASSLGNIIEGSSLAANS